MLNGYSFTETEWKNMAVIKTHSSYITDENCKQTEKHSAEEMGTCLQKFGSNVGFFPLLFSLFLLLFLISFFLLPFFLLSFLCFLLSLPCVCVFLHTYILSRKQAPNNLKLQTRFPQCFWLKNGIKLSKWWACYRTSSLECFLTAFT